MPKPDVNSNNSFLTLKKRLQGKGVGAILARGASGSFIVLMIGAAMAFGTNMLLARLMGVTQYGIYIYALTWVNLLSMLCKMGMDTSLLRFVAAYNVKKEWGLLRGILSRSLQYILYSSFLVLSIASVVVWGLYTHIGADQAKTFWISFLLLPLFGLTALRTAALRAFKHVVQAALPDSLFQRLVIVLLAIGFFIISKEDLQATQVMTFNVVGALFAFYVGTVWLLKAIPGQVRKVSSIYAEREWVKVSLPMFFMSGMYLILHQTDIIMLGVFADTKQAGIYAVSSRVAGLVHFGLIAANAIVAPMISELYSTGQHDKLQRMITLAARGIFLFTVTTSVILVIFGKSILNLFGEGFIMGYVPLLILLCGQMISSLAGSVGFLMTMTGHQNKAAQIVGTTAMFNIILNAVLITQLGTVGAAIATAISTATWNIVMLVYVWRKLKINPTVLAKT